MKNLLLLALLLPLNCAAVTDEQMRLCEHLSEVYGAVYTEIESGVAVDSIARHTHKKYPGYTENTISKIILHAKMLQSTGYSAQRIMGFVEGKCVTEMSVLPEKSEDAPTTKPQRNGVIT